MRYVDVAARAVLVVVFALALGGKVSSGAAWQSFADSLRQMNILKPSLVRPSARATAVAEAAIVVLALVPLRAAGTAAFVLASGLLAVLTYAVARVVRRGAAVPCRCFGASDAPLSARHVVRNTTLLTVALLGLAGSLAAGALAAPMVAIVVASGLVAGLLLARWDDLAALVSAV